MPIIPRAPRFDSQPNVASGCCQWRLAPPSSALPFRPEQSAYMGYPRNECLSDGRARSDPPTRMSRFRLQPTGCPCTVAPQWGKSILSSDSPSRPNFAAMQASAALTWASCWPCSRANVRQCMPFCPRQRQGRSWRIADAEIKDLTDLASQWPESIYYLVQTIFHRDSAADAACNGIQSCALVSENNTPPFAMFSGKILNSIWRTIIFAQSYSFLNFDDK